MGIDECKRELSEAQSKILEFRRLTLREMLDKKSIELPKVLTPPSSGPEAPKPWWDHPYARRNAALGKTFLDSKFIFECEELGKKGREQELLGTALLRRASARGQALLQGCLVEERDDAKRWLVKKGRIEFLSLVPQLIPPPPPHPGQPDAWVKQSVGAPHGLGNSFDTCELVAEKGQALTGVRLVMKDGVLGLEMKTSPFHGCEWIRSIVAVNCVGLHS